jgi:hypothetical protein
MSFEPTNAVFRLLKTFASYMDSLKQNSVEDFKRKPL